MSVAASLLSEFRPTKLAGYQQAGLLGLVGLIVAPFVVPNIVVLKLASALFFATFVMSWDFVSGYTGQISFGHALFFGVGGYASGLLNVYTGLHPLAAIPVGMVLAGVAGLVVGLPALRLEGPYISLVTLVAPLIMLRGVVFFGAWTGGETGLIGASKTPEGSFGAEPLAASLLGNYAVALAVFLLALVVFVVVTRSDAGQVFTAIRADEDAVSAAGLNPAKFKLFAFVLSGAVGGLAGAAFVHTTQGSVSPSQILSLTVSIEVIIAAILGGMGTVTGAAVGGFVFFFLRDALSGVRATVPLLDVSVGDLDLLIFSLLTLGFLFYLPEGMVPRLVARWTARAGEGETPLEQVVSSLEDALRRSGGGGE